MPTAYNFATIHQGTFGISPKTSFPRHCCCNTYSIEHPQTAHSVAEILFFEVRAFQNAEYGPFSQIRSLPAHLPVYIGHTPLRSSKQVGTELLTFKPELPTDKL